MLTITWLSLGSSPYTSRSNIVHKSAFRIVGFSIVAALAATPAFAGTVATPEPEVAGGLIAVGMLALGYRFLRGRFLR
jgi:hypothetical protein